MPSLTEVVVWIFLNSEWLVVVCSLGLIAALAIVQAIREKKKKN